MLVRFNTIGTLRYTSKCNHQELLHFAHKNLRINEEHHGLRQHYINIVKGKNNQETIHQINVAGIVFDCFFVYLPWSMVCFVLYPFYAIRVLCIQKRTAT